MWTILKVFGCFGCQIWGVLAPKIGVKPVPTASERKGLNTGPPGKSLDVKTLKPVLFAWNNYASQNTQYILFTPIISGL